MPKITAKKPKRPSAAKIREAGLAMEKAWIDFERSQLSFALMIYKAGNRDLESFLAAMEKSLFGSWRAWDGKIHIREKEAKFLFGPAKRLHEEAAK